MDSTSTNPEPQFCAACGERLTAGAQFCHACGVRNGERVPPGRPTNALPWSIAGIVVIAFVALLGGRAYGGRNVAAPGQIPLGRAPDISSIPPEERAQRLFTRVMAYASAGRDDSAAFFAPMAIGAIEALAPLNTHHRFDLGLVSFVIGDMRTASAHADSIVAQEPANLLGLALGMQSADVLADTARRDAFARRLLAAEQTEMRRQLPEYVKHDAELRSAIETAKGRRQ
jgi:hypothetical protein